MTTRFFFYIAAFSVFTGCASIPLIDAQTMTPAELINSIGPPSRITFANTVFGDKWTKDTTEYRYYFREPSGQVGHWSYYYKKQEWISAGGSVGFSERGNRILDIQCPRERSLIQAYEARNDWLKKK